MTIYFVYRADGTKRYEKNLSDLRDSVIMWMITQTGNMEMKILLYTDGPKPQVAGAVSLKWLNGYVYVLWYNASKVQTYRSYYDLDTSLTRWLKGTDINWIRLISLDGRQICMTGGSEDVYLAGMRLT